MDIKDYRGHTVLRMTDDKCYDTSGRWVYTVKGNYICNATGHWLYEIRGDKIYNSNGRWIYQIHPEQPYNPDETGHDPLNNTRHSPFHNTTHYTAQTTTIPYTTNHNQQYNTSHVHRPYVGATMSHNYKYLQLKRREPIIIAVICIFVLVIVIAGIVASSNDSDAGDTTVTITQPITQDEYQTYYDTNVIDDNQASVYEVPAQTQDTPIAHDTPVHDGPLTFGSTFQIDGSNGLIELTFGTDTFWGVIDSSWSQHYGETFFAIPITVRNLSSETGGLNQFDFSLFGSNGLSLDSVGLSLDYDITWESNMRAGASQTGLLYFLYDGDGEYVLEFSVGFGFGDSEEVFFQIVYDTGLHISDFDLQSFPPSVFVPLPLDNAYTLGDTFEFGGSSGDVEIALGTNISWMVVENSWSAHYGATVIAVPVAVTNTDTETGRLNSFDITMFGSDGLRQPSLGFYFDNDVTWEGDMRAGATQTGYFFFLYVGDGQYAMEFSAGFGFGDFIEVLFDVVR